MTRSLTIAALAALLAVPAAQAEARARHATAKAQPSAAIKSRQNVMNDFNARMSRLDALMGVPSTSSVRARSAEAGR
ncbi:outer membrane lipoprotein-sorting protein [Methylobacterium sp. PvP062]|jgi:outer membrane lipoprotein-sorting protein|uniref:Outer membrane lipoprotein-sorting protein n=1 Tax=Methylobacterium radiotolerans TaxID=31998 RepID=A0ABV2NM75_9HYPH|nr:MULTISPECIES: hypothetical protein [Methylobacterium]MBP2495666.1 outer membrane lipoprotein-sorting protein [Methylobacterium sp. PvP105]MBP2504463.1 outer membrane lipoprotein-sorting protein [Methylobacterium sp. PvP109]MCX7332071.1 hypothetical protein [Hyphomicrobiales bacterium]ONF47545.1 PepSY domain-like protein [Methylobacterium radiotolerans]